MAIGFSRCLRIFVKFLKVLNVVSQFAVLMIVR